MKKLVCDRCGLEITEKEDIETALEGKEAWEAACRARGNKPWGSYLARTIFVAAARWNRLLIMGFFGGVGGRGSCLVDKGDSYDGVRAD